MNKCRKDTEAGIKDPQAKKSGLAASIEKPDLLTVEFNQMPPWMKKEYQALSSILRFPEELNATWGDVRPELFFGGGTFAMARFILGRYTDHGELPEVTSIEKHLRAIFEGEDADRYFRLLQIAPTFCPHHVAHDLIWFAHERRFYRRLTDAFEDLREQEFSWKELLEYLFRAADLDDLQYDTCFTRLVALLCRSLLAPFSADRFPERWVRAVQSEDGLEDAFAAKTLHKIALQQLLAWESDGNSFLALDECTGFFGGDNPQHVHMALEKLKERGLIRARKSAEVDGRREFEELRVTAVSWLQLLPGDGSRE